MALKLRRVITGHDDQGRAIVSIDETAVHTQGSRPGAAACNVWTTEGFPIDNSGSEDEGKRPVTTVLDGGTIFRVIEFSPGVQRRLHRTNSTDYIIIMSGEIDMELEAGVDVHLTAGDVMVQRGTVHNWINRGSAPCVLAVILISANPAEAGGTVLHPAELP